MNAFPFETNYLASVILNWMLMLGNLANFWARAWPKIAVWSQSFSLCDLTLVSDLYFPKKAPKSVNRTVSQSTFITVILINEGLILPDFVQNIQAHALRDRFYLDTSDAFTKVNMLQPRQLTCLWNKNRFPKYSQI